jgi:hypothetical protein
MNTLLIVIPFHAGDAAQAEYLCDYIYALHGHKPIGHALLVADDTVHEEMRAKVKIAAEVAFETVDLMVSPPFDRIGKPERINRLFNFTAATIAAGYRLPWFWLEPDCVPLTKTWLVDLSMSYHSQPKRYLGAHLKTKTKDDKEVILLSRIACYPPNAHAELEPYCGNTNVTFNLVAAKTLVDRSNKTKLIQHFSYNHETDQDKIRPDAALLHSDKAGSLIRHLRSRIAPKASENGHAAIPETPKPRGRRPTVNAATPMTV